MSANIRQPFIQGTDKEQLAQIRAYLYQLAPELQFALENIEAKAPSSGGTQSGGGTTIINQNQITESISRPPTEEEILATFGSIKNLIIKDGDIKAQYYEDFASQLNAATVYQLENVQGELTTLIKAAQSNIEVNADNLKLANDKIEKIKTDAEDYADAVVGALEGDIQGKIEGVDKKLDGISGSFQVDESENAAYIVRDSGYIKTGFLSDDEYGVEIGHKETVNEQTVKKGTMRITPYLISIYGDQGVAEPAKTKISYNSVTTPQVYATEYLDVGGFRDIISDPITGHVTTKWMPPEQEATVMTLMFEEK